MRVWVTIVGALCFVGSPQLVGAAGTAPAPWTGLYVGVNGGWATTDSKWNNLASTAAFVDTLPPASFSESISGALGGVQLGYNIQSGALVFGAEVLANIGSIAGEKTSPFGAADDIFDLRIEAMLAATGRIGYAWDSGLIYVKGGIAAAFVKASVSDTVGPTTGSGRDDSWRFGPTVGVGFFCRPEPPVVCRVMPSRHPCPPESPATVAEMIATLRMSG